MTLKNRNRKLGKNYVDQIEGEYQMQVLKGGTETLKKAAEQAGDRVLKEGNQSRTANKDG